MPIRYRKPTIPSENDPFNGMLEFVDVHNLK